MTKIEMVSIPPLVYFKTTCGLIIGLNRKFIIMYDVAKGLLQSIIKEVVQKSKKE